MLLRQHPQGRYHLVVVARRETNKCLFLMIPDSPPLGLKCKSSIRESLQGILIGKRSGAGVTTTGLWHYLANITDKSIATEFAQFSAATADGFKTKSTAGVINRIKGREQVCLLQILSFSKAYFTRWFFSSVSRPIGV